MRPVNPQMIDKLRQDLLVARKNREQLTTETLQSILTRITNAEAVPSESMQTGFGVGTTERPRKILSPEEVQTVILQEIDELKEAQTSMAAYPGHPYVADLAKKIAILSRYTLGD